VCRRRRCSPDHDDDTGDDRADDTGDDRADDTGHERAGDDHHHAPSRAAASRRGVLQQ
jgi:hypothetical protein